MHICPVTRNKVEHPRAEIIRSKEMSIPLLRRHHFIEIHEIHKATSQYSLLLAAQISEQLYNRKSYLDCPPNRNPPY
jgi:hypothetical protein